MAFDATRPFTDLDTRGAKAVIAQHPRRAKLLNVARRLQMAPSDRERFLQAQESKRIAMRSDRTDRSFSAMIHLVPARIHSRWISTGPSLDRTPSET